MSYSAATDLNSTFGTVNVTAWADLDNDADAEKIAARILWAIALADEMIDDLLRDGRYVVPIVGMGSGVPKTIVHLSATMAGLLLYEARGIQDFDPNTGQPQHRLAYHKTRFRETINSIISGRLKLNAVLQTNTHVPEVVKALGTAVITGFEA